MFLIEIFKKDGTVEVQKKRGSVTQIKRHLYTVRGTIDVYKLVKVHELCKGKSNNEEVREFMKGNGNETEPDSYRELQGA